MKIIESNKPIESIEILGKDGEALSIWIPQNVEIAFEGIELNEDENEVNCEVSIHCKAKIENINIIQEAL